MLKIIWLGQSGYILKDEKTTIVIDPYLSDCVFEVAGRKRLRSVPVEPQSLMADAVILTHNHLDHIDPVAIKKMDKNMTFYSPRCCKETLISLGVLKYLPFDEGDSYKIGDFLITAVFAKHSVPSVGVLVTYGEETLYFSGDTLYDERLEKIKCDYMFICINGKLGNMNVYEAAHLAKVISPRVAVPNHYDMFLSNAENPEKFKNATDLGFIMEFNREYEVKNRCLI